MAWDYRQMCQLGEMMAGKKIERIDYDPDAQEFTIFLDDDLVIKWDEKGPWIFEKVFDMDTIKNEPPPTPSTT